MHLSVESHLFFSNFTLYTLAKELALSVISAFIMYNILGDIGEQYTPYVMPMFLLL